VASGPARHRLWRALGDHRDTAVLVALLAGFLVARLLVLWGLEVFTSFDTGSYAPRPASSPQVDTLSFTGDAPRPWGVPLLYAAVGADTARAVLQWVVGTIAWSVLAVGVWVTLRTLTARIVATLALLGLALTPQVYTWDYAILSESLSIELGVLALGLFALWVATGSRAAAVALGVVGVWWTFTRPDTLPFVLATLLALVVYALLRVDRRRTSLLVAGVLLLGVVWLAGTVSRSDDAFRTWGLQLGLAESTFVYRLRLQVYPDERVRDVYTRELGMPRCPAAEAASTHEQWRIERFVAAYRSCPDLVAWTARERITAPVRYALAEPAHFAELTRGALAEMLGGAVYASTSPALPRAYRALYFPSPRWSLRALGAAFVVALAALALTGAFRRRPGAALGGIALVATSGLSALGGSLYSAGEYPRFGIQEAIFLRVGLVLMAAVALDTFFARRREATAEIAGR
jgi:hypothetical protein